MTNYEPASIFDDILESEPEIEVEHIYPCYKITFYNYKKTPEWERRANNVVGRLCRRNVDLKKLFYFEMLKYIENELDSDELLSQTMEE